MLGRIGVNWALRPISEDSRHKRRRLMCHFYYSLVPGSHLSCSGSLVFDCEQSSMGFTWVIKNFVSFRSKPIFSDQFISGGCKWQLVAYPKGSKSNNNMSLVLKVADFKNLPSGWRRHAKYRFTVVNQTSEKLSVFQETQQWFDEKGNAWGFGAMLPISKLYAKDGGFLVNGEVKIVAEVEVLEVVGGLDVLEEPEEVTQLSKRVKREEGVESQDLLNESMSVNVDLPFQVEYFNRVLTKHPEMALVFQAKSQYLRKACMLVLQSLIETLCKSLEELSNDDLVEADNSLTYLKLSGFKVDWLEKKLDEVKERKKEKQIGETRIQELEGGLKDYRQKCSDIEAILEREKEELKNVKEKCLHIEALLEKEKAKVLAAETPPLTVDDIIG